MIKRGYILILMSILVASCDKSTIENPTQEYGGEVIFTLEEEKVDWTTRGQSIDSATEITSIGVYALCDYADDTNKTLYINNTAGVKNGDYWHFSPSMYYPVGKSLKCFAYSPYGTGNETNGVGNGITTSFDKASETMTISYLAPTLDTRNQPDILVASGIGSEDGLAFNYTHALTKITLSARLSNASTAQVTDPVSGTQTDPKFYITRFTMQHVATLGTLTCSATDEGVITIGDAANASGPWIINQPSRSPVIASNAYIIADPTGTYSNNGDDEPVELVYSTDSYQNVMKSDQALFMLPQRIETLVESGDYSQAPTIFITIYEAVTGTYYRTDEMELKTPNGARFEMGQYINYNFEFDVSDDNIVIDMSLIPEVLDWDDRQIDVDIDPNIYLVLDDNYIVDNQVILYTNSAVTPVVTSLTEGVTAEVTAGSAPDETPGSHTIGDATLTAYTITFSGTPTDGGDAVKISVVGYADGPNTDAETEAGKPNETKITKVFNLTIK